MKLLEAAQPSLGNEIMDINVTQIYDITATGKKVKIKITSQNVQFGVDTKCSTLIVDCHCP